MSNEHEIRAKLAKLDADKKRLEQELAEIEADIPHEHEYMELIVAERTVARIRTRTWFSEDDYAKTAAWYVTSLDTEHERALAAIRAGSTP